MEVRDLAPALERSMAVVCRNLFREQSELLTVGRFELVSTLGRGGMGVVYEAHDPLRRERVALKMLNGTSASDLYRLKQEFRSLAALSHPNLVELHELSVAGQVAFFTMELIRGQDVVSYVRQEAAPGTPSAQERLLQSLAQLYAGIRELHAAGKLHRDLKPSNVLVTPEGRVVLLDFGLVQDERVQDGVVEGTLAYMAPEQRQGRAGQKSDWYSFGRIIQEAMGGQLGDPSDPLQNADLRRLAQLARGLLEAAPDKRPGWQEIGAVVHGEGRLENTHGASRSELFVGRELELATLERSLVASRLGPVMVHVRGEAGIGKSTLVRVFTDSVRNTRNAVVLRGRCYEREFVPYKALDSAVDELSQHLLVSRSHSAAGLSPKDRKALVHLFPVLGRVPDLSVAGASTHTARPDDVHPVELRRRGFEALKRILAGIARERPLVLWIDDVQWSDADSGALLATLLRDHDAPPMLVICCQRSEVSILNPALEELSRAAILVGSPGDKPAQVVELSLAALPEHAALAFVQLLHRQERLPSRAIPEQIALESRGNPLFLRALSHWSTTLPGAPGAQDASEVKPSFESLVTSRVDGLSAAAKEVLTLIALAGRPVAASVVLKALSLEGHQYPLLAELTRARLVHSVRRSEDELLEIEHDRIGEVVRRRIEPAQRPALHARLARAFDAADNAYSEASIAQYIAAQLPEEAAQRARHAGQLALSALAFSRAVWLFQQALELGSFSDASRAGVYRDLALSLEHAGRGLEAAAAYQQAAAFTQDPFVAVQLKARAVSHLMHHGKLAESAKLIRHCYETLGLEWPEGRAAQWASLLSLALRLSLGKAPPLSRLQTDDPLRLARVRMMSTVGSSLEGFDPLRSLLNALLVLREARHLSDAGWRARAQGLSGFLRTVSLLPRSAARGLAELEAAHGTAQQLGDHAAVTDLERQLSVAAYLSGDARAALAWANRCEANLRLLPLAPRDLYVVMGLIGSALWELGRLREARERFEAFGHEARHHDDLLTRFWIHTHPAQLAALVASNEREPAAAILAQQAELRNQHPRFKLLVWAQAVCRVESELHWGSPTAAYELLEHDWSALSMPFYPVLREASLLLRLRTILGAAAQCPPGNRRVRLLMRARLYTLELCWSARPSPRAGYLLARASVALLSGKRERAQERLAEAIALLEATEMKLMLASARYCQGALLGGSRGQALMETASHCLREEGVVDPARWVSWTVPGFRAILSVT